VDYPQVIVLEPLPLLAFRLQVALPERRWVLREARHAADLKALVPSAGCVVVLALSATALPAWEALAWLTEDRPRAAAVAVLATAGPDLAAAARDLGAVHVVGPDRLDELPAVIQCLVAAHGRP
jgi:hypothetical protein